MRAVRIKHLLTSGTFSLYGGIVGEDHEATVVDVARDADTIAAAAGDRRVVVIVCTHDHIEAPSANTVRAKARSLLYLHDWLPLSDGAAHIWAT